MAKRKQRNRNPGAKPEKWPQATRAKALELYVNKGKTGAEVEQLTGVPQTTVRVWAKQARDRVGAQPPKDMTPAQRETWGKRKEAAANEQFEAMRAALKQTEKFIEEGDMSKAKAAAVTVGILADKSGMLEEAARNAEQRQAKITEEQGQLLASVIRRTLEDIGIPPEPAADVLKHYLTQAARGEPLTPAPGAEDARRATLARVLSDWEGSLPIEERLALPASGQDADSDDKTKDDHDPPIEGDAVELIPDEDAPTKIGPDV